MGRAIAPVNSRQGARGHHYSITSSARASSKGGIDPEPTNELPEWI